MSAFDINIDVEMTGLDNFVKAAGPAANVGFARALNHTGAKVRTRYLREVRQLLGIKKHPFAKTGAVEMIKRNTSVLKANPASLKYSLAGWGRGLNLIYYQPKETPAGATVMWLGARKLVPRSFFKGGKFPRRKRSSISHLVWQRTGPGRWTLDKPKGPGLPEGMVHPAAADVWTSQARALLEPRLAHELSAILMGHVSGANRWAGEA